MPTCLAMETDEAEITGRIFNPLVVQNLYVFSSLSRSGFEKLEKVELGIPIGQQT